MSDLKYVEALPKYMEGVTNIRRTNSAQYQWLYEHGCTHRHRFTRHFNCFCNQYGIHERKGFLDIEASNLKANFGIMLCYCIYDEDGVIWEDWVTPEDVRAGIEDKRIVETCVATMNHFDRIVTHFGTYYDLPFIRTRALIHGIEFPEEGTLFHTDVWKMAKSKLCIHSNRQDVVAEALHGSTVKTRIDQRAWRQAMMGNVEAMAEVVDHCEKDVEDLARNYITLLPYYRETKSYI